MSQRNPLNERYQGDGPVGSTKGSTSNAKPKRKAAGTVYTAAPVSQKDKKKEQKAKERAFRQERQELLAAAGQPKDPNYKKYRIQWACGLAGGLLFAGISWALMGRAPQWVSILVLCFAYAAIIWAFIVDTKKIRPIRLQHEKQVFSLSKKEQQKLLDEYHAAELEKLQAKAAKKNK